MIALCALALLAQTSAEPSLNYLRGVMDQYHTRVAVYDDVSSAGNHFLIYTKSDPNAPVTMNGSWAPSPHSGATSIRAEYVATSPSGGYDLQSDAGIDLSGATALTFWARGAVGGEQIEFLGSLTTLTSEWKQYTIVLTGVGLSSVRVGFSWRADSTHNPNGAVFFLDDIQYELSPAARAERLNQPRFLRSYTTLPAADLDLVLRNLAFTYDNALALLAFLADGSSDSVRRARLIGDAFVYATQHDRTFRDNRSCNDPIVPASVDGARLRTGYAAGDLALPSGSVPVSGFYLDPPGQFIEIEQGAVDVGNNAWAGIALMALYKRTGDARYLETACRLGNFIAAFRSNEGFGGFTGGVNDPEGATPTLRPFASSEHNIDAFVLFTLLYQATGETRWRDHAEHARSFLDAMWDDGRGCFLTGTGDPHTRNTTPGQLPLDVQAWSIIALPGVLTSPHNQMIRCAETYQFNTHDGLTGFDFNEDKDGVWLEGTGQMAVAYAFAGFPNAAAAMRATLRAAEQNGQGIPAASHDGLTTGFGFNYYRRLHVGATAWNVFAQLAFNPYYAETIRIKPRTARH